VHEGDRLAAGLDGAFDCEADQTLGAKDADGLDADTGVGANFLFAAFEPQKIVLYALAGILA